MKKVTLSFSYTFPDGTSDGQAIDLAFERAQNADLEDADVVLDPPLVDGICPMCDVHYIGCTCR